MNWTDSSSRLYKRYFVLLLIHDKLFVIPGWDKLVLNRIKGTFSLRKEVASCQVAVTRCEIYILVMKTVRKAPVDNFSLPIGFECLAVFFSFRNWSCQVQWEVAVVTGDDFSLKALDNLNFSFL